MAILVNYKENYDTTTTTIQWGLTSVQFNLVCFLDAIASLQVPYIQVTHYVRTSQSAKYLLGQDSRPFREVQVVKKAKGAIMALKALMASTAMMANIAIWAITAISTIKAITTVTPMRAIRFNTGTRAAREIVAIKAKSH